MRDGDKVMTPTQKEAILQLEAIGHTKKEIAKTIGVDITTVYRYLKKARPEQLKESRREALERIASRMTEHVEKQIDRLDPDEKMTYLQRMTGIGIGTDKVIAVDKQIMAQEAQEAAPQQTALLPSSIEALVGAIRNDIKSLDVSILRVHLDKDDAALVQDLSLETPLPRVIDAEVTHIEDLDVGGPGGA